MSGDRADYLPRRTWPNGLPRRSFQRWIRHMRPLRWSLENWRKGYQFRPIQRCRRCDHTSPYHYRTCVWHPTNLDRTQGPNVCSTCGLFIHAGVEPRAVGTGSYCLTYGVHEPTTNDAASSAPAMHVEAGQ